LTNFLPLLEAKALQAQAAIRHYPAWEGVDSAASIRRPQLMRV
jgi:hypothetical protein